MNPATMKRPAPQASAKSNRVRLARSRFLMEIRSCAFPEGVAIVCDFLEHDEADLDGITTAKLLTALHGFSVRQLEPLYAEAGLARDPSERRIRELCEREKERICEALRRRCE